ncbi:hypothetical protein [Humibacter sp.]|uniref:hypothetical protein n=1 Tax=Humibacter sp. TaxID=1940291 RepID=UPI003F7E2E1A
MSIKDSVFGQVAGTVGRVNDGRFVIEVRTREDAKYPDYVTVWQPRDAAPITVGEGDRISVKGWLSWRKSEKDGKTYFNVSLNGPQLVDHEPEQASGGESWDAASTPF